MNRREAVGSRVGDQVWANAWALESLSFTKYAFMGDVLGATGRYMGSCSECRTQFMSTHDRVFVGHTCSERCARKHAYYEGALTTVYECGMYRVYSPDGPCASQYTIAHTCALPPKTRRPR